MPGWCSSSTRSGHPRRSRGSRPGSRSREKPATSKLPSGEAAATSGTWTRWRPKSERRRPRSGRTGTRRASRTRASAPIPAPIFLMVVFHVVFSSSGPCPRGPPLLRRPWACTGHGDRCGRRFTAGHWAPTEVVDTVGGSAPGLPPDFPDREASDCTKCAPKLVQMTRSRMTSPPWAPFLEGAWHRRGSGTLGPADGSAGRGGHPGLQLAVPPSCFSQLRVSAGLHRLPPIQNATDDERRRTDFSPRAPPRTTFTAAEHTHGVPRGSCETVPPGDQQRARRRGSRSEAGADPQPWATCTSDGAPTTRIRA